MFLAAPTSAQAPKPNRSQKGAFTNRAPPKIKKFVPKDDEGDEEGPGKPKIKEKAPDSAFMTWLRAKQTSSAVHVDVAKDYILEGAPFRGDSSFEAKEAVKECGGGWSANPDKRKDCEDKSIRRGWWAAHDEAVLLKLLRLDPDDRGRRQWKPLDMGETQIGVLISWLDDFFGSDEAVASASDGAKESEAGPQPKRARSSAGAPAAKEQTPQWIIDYHARYVHIWTHDTKCIACGEMVTDQFMDCNCGPHATWQRCAKCGEKYRTDFKKGSGFNANAWCACKGKR